MSKGIQFSSLQVLLSICKVANSVNSKFVKNGRPEIKEIGVSIDNTNAEVTCVRFYSDSNVVIISSKDKSEIDLYTRCLSYVDNGIIS